MVERFNKEEIIHIRGVDHPESIGIGPNGNPYTTGTGRQVYRADLETNAAKQIATTEFRCLGSVIDADGIMYAAQISGANVLKITPDGTVSTYASAPDGESMQCPNYPAFDRDGNMYLSESGDWSGKINGRLWKIQPGGGTAKLWYPEPVDTPNAIALDAEENHLYFVETFGHAISRIAINSDGSAGAFERVVHMPRQVPDGIAFDSEGRLWIACHRPDAIYCYDLKSRHLSLFCEDWTGEALRGPTDVSFAGPNRDIILAASLDNLVIHRFNDVGVTGLRLNYPSFT